MYKVRLLKCSHSFLVYKDRLLKCLHSFLVYKVLRFLKKKWRAVLVVRLQ